MLAAFLSVGFVSCGKDNDNENKSSYYYLNYERDQYYVQLGWNTSTNTSYLSLKFDEGIPKGSEWHLTCDETWVKPRNSRGKVNFQSENVPITIEDNTHYEDREAHIYLDVDNGLPFTSSTSTVTICQYGYEYYLNHGPEFSFDTDRSLANDNPLELKIDHLDNVVEIDWGDGTKEVYNEKESYQSLNHQYSSSTKTYRVKLRFSAWDSYGGSSSFYLIIGAEQGISAFYDNDGRILYSTNDTSRKKHVLYSDGNYSFN